MFNSAHFSRLLLLCLAYVSWASAQDLAQLVGSLSPNCQAAAGGVATSDFGTCANIMGLVPVLGANGSVLAPLSGWVDAICSSSPCPEATAATALSTVNQGCQSDAQKGNPGALALGSIISNYATIRQAVCLQYAANSTRCFLSTLGDLEKATHKQFALPEVQGVLTAGFSALAPLLGNVPKEAFCTDCVHGLITVLSGKTSPPTTGNQTTALATGAGSPPGQTPAAPGGRPAGPGASGQQPAAAAVSAICGPTFADGKIPTTLSASGSKGNSSSISPAGNANNAANSASVGNHHMFKPVFAALSLFVSLTFLL